MFGCVTVEGVRNAAILVQTLDDHVALGLLHAGKYHQLIQLGSIK